jgi:hypothetical protein
MAEEADGEVRRLTELRESLTGGRAADPTDESFFGFAALDYGLRLNAMQAEWARSVIDRLDT